jgi:hypothetical protein
MWEYYSVSMGAWMTTNDPGWYKSIGCDVRRKPDPYPAETYHNPIDRIGGEGAIAWPVYVGILALAITLAIYGWRMR